MSKKIIVGLIGFLFLLIFQIAFLNGLPVWGRDFNIILVAIVFILGIYGLKPALISAVVCGLILDFYSFSVFGLNLVVWPLTILLTGFLLTNFFTNRSLYSFLALTIFASLSLVLFFYGGDFLIGWLQGQSVDWSLGLNFWYRQLRSLTMNSLGTIVIFYILNFFSKKFKPAILAQIQ